MKHLYTISTTAAREVKSGDGSTTVFTFSFVFRDPEDLTVTLVQADGTRVLKRRTTDYTVAGGGQVPAAGSVTTTSFVAASGEKLVIERAHPLIQAEHLVSAEPLSAKTIETAFDNLILRIQEISDRLGRAVQIPKTADPTTPPKITVPVPATGQFLIGLNSTTWGNTTTQIEDLAVTAAKLASLAVTAAKFADGAVDTAKIADAAVLAANIAAGAVTTAKLADGAVTTAKVPNDNVTLAKLAHLTQGSLIAYGAGGVPSELGGGGDPTQFLISNGTDPIWGSLGKTLNFSTGPNNLRTNPLNPTEYFGVGNLSTTEGNVQIPISQAGVITGMHAALSVSVGTNMASGTPLRRLFLSKNGQDTPLSLTFVEPSKYEFVTGGSEVVAPGDLLSIRAGLSGIADATRANVALIIEGLAP